MLRQSRIAWQGVSVSPSQITHLPRQVHHPQPTRHFQPVVPTPTRPPTLLLAKPPDHHFVPQPPLLNHQGTHRFPSHFHHVVFQSVQVMFRPYPARLHHRHGSPPHFGERFRIVKTINTPYHQYQLAHIRSPDVRLSAQCRHRGYSYGPILIKGASHHFGALTKFVETRGVVEIEQKRIVVRFDKRGHNPILREAGLDQPRQTIPWLQNLPLVFQRKFHPPNQEFAFRIKAYGILARRMWTLIYVVIILTER